MADLTTYLAELPVTPTTRLTRASLALREASLSPPALVREQVVSQTKLSIDTQIVRFRWSADLVAVRRATFPGARWLAGQRAWAMMAMKAETFIARSNAWLHQVRNQTEIAVDEERWLALIQVSADLGIA